MIWIIFIGRPLFSWYGKQSKTKLVYLFYFFWQYPVNKSLCGEFNVGTKSHRKNNKFPAHLNYIERESRLYTYSLLALEGPISWLLSFGTKLHAINAFDKKRCSIGCCHLVNSRVVSVSQRVQDSDTILAWKKASNQSQFEYNYLRLQISWE